MFVYTYSDARQNLATVLNNAKKTGKVIIKRKDGSQFSLMPEITTASPLDVPSINCKISLDDILTSIDDGRKK